MESENPRYGSYVTQEEDRDLDTQKWILKEHSKNVYSILSKCGNLYIDVGSSNLQNGQKLQVKGETDLATQQFIFVNETPSQNIEQIAEGVYQITLKSNKVLDVVSGSYSNAANVQIWNTAKVQQQKFHITRVGDTNAYKIVAVHSAKALNVQGENSNLQANVNQYEQNGTDNQSWYFKKTNDGYYTILSKANGLCFDIANGGINNNGQNVQLYYDNGTDAQKFKLTPVNIIDNNTYEIETRLDSNKVLDVAGGSIQDGANIQLWRADNVEQQRFVFEALSTDTYKIIAKHSNKALTVDTSSNNVYQTTYTGADTQQWRIQEAGEGYYTFVSEANGYALDIKSAGTGDGQNVQVYAQNGTNAQRFKLVAGFRRFFQEGTYGRSGLAIQNGWGANLKYYKIGKGPKTFFAIFSIHGFEDSYAHDGAELTYIAEEFKNYLLNSSAVEAFINNWTIYIFPDINPDGQIHGWTNNGPGRTTLYSAAPGNKGIDMNRNWSSNGDSYPCYNDNRNYNGTAPFQAYEARDLREFILNHQGSKNILVDTHGWLNETIGDYDLGSSYRYEYGIYDHIHTYGRGYLVNWARGLYNAKSLLVELPQVWGHDQTVNWGYAQKYINATMQVLRDN